MKVIIVVAVLALAFAASAGAETYWLRYEGDDYPENEGWTRIWNQPFAQRAIEDGVFVLDASADRHTCEWYEYYTDNGCAWPMEAVETGEPSSHFFVQWNVEIDRSSGSDWGGTTVAFFAPDSSAVSFSLSEDTIRSLFEPGVSAVYAGGVPHEFEVRFSDMQGYELYIDGSFAFAGSFYDSIWSNKILFGEPIAVGLFSGGDGPGTNCAQRHDRACCRCSEDASGEAVGRSSALPAGALPASAYR